MSLVDLGKRLLEAARKGQDDEVRTLMANGAPFTTDWVSSLTYSQCVLLPATFLKAKETVLIFFIHFLPHSPYKNFMFFVSSEYVVSFFF